MPLESPQYTEITLGANLKSPRYEDDSPFVIGRDVTINGAGRELTLDTGGIVLGGNVTLNNIAVTFISPTRNAIIANGYKLALNDVTTTQDKFPLNVFAGSVTGYTGNIQIPQTGTHGEVVVTGVCQLGQIFAGSLSEGTDEASSLANQFEHPATITLDAKRGSKIGDIYAHGAREPRDGLNPGGMVGNPEKYKVTKEVTIKLNGSSSNNVFGKTGGPANAKVVFNDKSGYVISNLTATDVAELVVEEGKLDLKQGSTFTPDANITIKGSKSELHLKKLNNLSINNFTAAGTDCYLVLGERQTLTIKDSVTGKTNVAVGGFLRNESTEEPVLGHTYIIAPNSKAGDFTLVVKNLKDKYFEKSADSKWKVASRGGSTGKVELTSFDFLDKNRSVSESEFKLSVEYGLDCSFKNDQGSLDKVKMTYTVSSGLMKQTAARQPDGTSLIKSWNLKFSQQGDAFDEKYIFVEPINPDDKIYPGTYVIEILVVVDKKVEKKTITLEITPDGETPPAEHKHVWGYQADGARLIATCSGAGNCSIDNKTAVLEIQAPENLKFDGKEKHATITGSIPDVQTPELKYTDGSVPVDVGTYEAFITLNDQTAKLKFTIEKAEKKQLADIDLKVQNDVVDISVSDVARDMPENAKELGYVVGTPTTSKGAQISEQKVVDGTLTAKVTNGSAGEVIVFPVTISSKNYENSTVNVNVTLADKHTVTIDTSSVTAQSGEYNGQAHTGYTGDPTSDGYNGQLDKVYTGTLENGSVYNEVNVAPTQAGTYAVVFKVPDSDRQFIGQSNPVSFHISQKSLQWNVDALAGTKVYDGTTNPPAITGDVKIEGMVDKDQVNLIYTEIVAPNLSAADVGDYPLELELKGSKIEGDQASNYALPTAKPQVTVTVTRAEGKGSVTLESWNAGETAKKPIAKTTTNDENQVVFEYKAEDAAENEYKGFENPPTAIGKYILRATFAETKNYKQVVVHTNFAIEDKKTVTIDTSKVTAQSGEYNGQAYTGYTGEPTSDRYKGQFDKVYTGTLANGDEYNQVNVAPTQAGSYTVAFKVPDSDLQFSGKSDPISFEISQKPLQWNVDTLAGTKVYDGTTNPPAITGDVKIEGMVDTDQVNLIYTEIVAPTLSAADVGDYPLELELKESKLEGADSSNYALPIAKPQVTVTVTRAEGKGSVTIESWNAGEAAKKPVAKTTTNDENQVVFEYKAEDVAENEYKGFENPPTAIGKYILRATFAETKNYKQVVAHTNFAVNEPEQIQKFTVEVSSNLNEGGTVNGGGQFNKNDDVTVEAIAHSGFKFTHWEEDGLPIKDAGAVYTFKATKDRKLVAVFEKETPPSTDTSKIEKNELTTVPESLSQYETIDELKEAMIKVSTEQDDYTRKDMQFYNVKLKLTYDNGDTWQDATESNFPTEGLVVEFLYEDIAPNVGKDTHDFKVAHMYSITSERLGTVAGEIETPQVTKLDDKIRVTLKGLSPVSISWKPVQGEENDNTNPPKPTNPPQPTTPPQPTVPPQPTAAPQPTATPQPTNGDGAASQESPKTGDNSYALYALFVMMLSTGVAMTMSYIRSKKEQ